MSTDFEDTTSTVCTAECCSLTRSKPYQLTSKDILAKTKRIQGHGRNQQVRYVQPKWFKEHSRLTLCTTRQRVFCFTVQVLQDVRCFLSVGMPTQLLYQVVSATMQNLGRE